MAASQAAIGQKCEENALVKKICSEALPVNARILILDSEPPCYCECPALVNIRQSRYNQLLLDRDSTWRANRNAFLQRASRLSIAGAGVVERNSSVIDLTNEGRIYWDSAANCQAALHLRDICANIGRIDALRPITDSLVFSLITEDHGGQAFIDLFPSADSRYDHSSGKVIAIIRIPERMLHDRSVGRELMTFILLHEIHHIVDSTPNEHDADLWAATVGLYLYNGNEWPHANYLDRVATQLENYTRSQIMEDQYLLATQEPPYGLNSYPELTCRLERIRHPCTNFTDTGPTLIKGYPTECWNESVPSAHQEREETLRPTGQECTDLSGLNRITLVSDRDFNRLRAAHERYRSIMEQWCEQRPQLCGEAFLQQIDPAIRERDQRRLSKRVERAIRTVQGLENNLKINPIRE